MVIKNVTCEFVHHPIALDCRHPRFSWEIEADENNVYQTAWQIIVRNADSVVMWDSGSVPR